MSKNRLLKIGIVGGGSIVKQRHIPGIRKDGNAKIVAVCNSTMESSRSFCAEFAPEAEPFESYPEVVSHPDVEIVWIGTPPHLHREVSVASLRSGKHVFCQSRMAMDLPEAEEMWETSLSNPELVATLCPPPMGLRADRWIRNALADGIIGTPHQIVLRSCNAAYLDPTSPPHWRQREEISGLQILTLGIYLEIVQRWLGAISAVTAHAKTVTPARDGYQIEIPDILHVLCSFANGAEGSLIFSGVAAHAGGDSLEIYGSEGTLLYDFEKDVVKVARRESSHLEVIDIPPESERLWTVESDFLAAVRAPNSPRPEPDFTDGLQYMRVVAAVHRSLSTHSRMSIP